jgi:plasmid stabilization system protein ParE
VLSGLRVVNFRSVNIAIRVDARTVVVLRVLHASRDIEQLLGTDGTEEK